MTLKADIDLKAKSIHLMGIGGAGMSGLALLLDQIGARVSGCDSAESTYLQNLKKHNIPIQKPHKPHHTPH